MSAGATIAYFERGASELALARPDRANALDADTARALLAGAGELTRDPRARVIFLTGEGKHFCSGAEVGRPQTGEEGARPDDMGALLRDALRAWDAMPKPTIGFVQGACIGAGLALASCCDVVIADPDAFFAIPEIRLGMIPRLSPFFARAIGPRAFRRYALSGERFSADVALRCGLVSEIVERGAWGAARARLLDSYLHAAPRAFAAMKRQARTFEAIGVDSDPAAQATEDGDPSEAAEGKASFKEKRKPSWYLAQ